MYPIQQIQIATSGVFLKKKIAASAIEYLLFDSRLLNFPKATLFFAIQAERRDGHDFIANLYQKGVRNFIVEKKIKTRPFPKANFILVKNSVHALQQLAIFHRNQFSLKTIGITGSNGKTIVKEWLLQFLQNDYRVVASPKSYNSQIGVPMSVWLIKKEHTLGIFEAGISTVGEMKFSEKIIQPEIGIFTNIGDAHNQGFENIGQKINEKLKLFANCKTIVYCKDDIRVHEQMQQFGQKKLFDWSKKTTAKLQIISTHKRTQQTTITAIFNKKEITITIPFTDEASIENAIHCWALLLFFKKKNTWIAQKIQQLRPIPMRLEIKAGVNNCLIINDSYNADLTALKIALNHLEQQGKLNQRTLILSDILQLGKNKKQTYQTVAQLIEDKKISKLIGIGHDVFLLKKFLNKNIQKLFFKTTLDFLKKTKSLDFQNENILLKGARPFAFEKIAERLSQKNHKTVLEINLNALVHNLNVYNRFLHPKTKIIAMVKAAAYGSGSIEIAKLLEFQKVDYFAVAYADEGVELRKAGIHLPIIVLNPEEAIFDILENHLLEPEIYSLDLLEKLAQRFSHKNQKILVHLKLDTGMKRLGFEEKDLKQLVDFLKKNPQLKVQSIFSHLVGSEAKKHDDFTKKQVARFQKMYDYISTAIKKRPMRHILNSSGINRFPEYQMEMVRLGIGLYGIDGSAEIQNQLQKVHTLKATISQIKNVATHETIGYSRKGIAKQPMRIATISIGYADGLMRVVGNGKFSVLIQGKRASIVGNICMDMCMVNVTDIPEAAIGDEVIIFGYHPTVEALAKAMNTIPYEIFSTISERVRRVYFNN
ncbi:MAG TPA: bifunctional UDP-N-acetylmuramoyl-tripeptide:D-alanyl-D-alanine ligase/alanine racemase [Phaeodactylibacter sp.]|nr:bifunctional UDP-N-acetylmuramoyl-tripeptide:D-alanyl-D-alanine ligase/alanine racemase [Phaeodactylibacter sp.]